MINCERCGLFSKGQSSICERNYSRKNKKDDYESLDEFYEITDKKEYFIMAGYNSRYDMCSIILTGEIRNLNECKEKHPWLMNIGAEVDNLCDECVEQMLINKEAISLDGEQFVVPFYTTCCGKLFTDVSHDFFYHVEEINIFPYCGYFRLLSWNYIYGDDDSLQNQLDNQKFIKQEFAFFNYHENCTACKECVIKNNDKFETNMDMLETIERNGKNHPSFSILRRLRGDAVQYLDFDLRGNETILTPSLRELPHLQEEYKDTFYMYSSKKNNLLIKNELKYYVAERNLTFLRKYFPISNDIIIYILENFI